MAREVVSKITAIQRLIELGALGRKISITEAKEFVETVMALGVKDHQSDLYVKGVMKGMEIISGQAKRSEGVSGDPTSEIDVLGTGSSDPSR